MADWAALDVTAAVAWMRERYKTLPLNYVGHSFGGQALGLLANNAEVSRALLIAAQAGYWKLMATPERYRVYAMLNFVGSPLTRGLGYAPGWSGVGEDLPKGVFQQWAGWVMNSRYLFDDPTLKPALSNFAGYKGALRSLCLSDDPWATRPAVELLCSGFTAAKPEILTVTPADAGATKIGHLGFFRPEHRDTLWPVLRNGWRRGIAIPPSCPGERRDDGERGARCRLTRSRHTPRKRGIQYAAASRVHVNISGILDHPLSRMMTAWGSAKGFKCQTAKHTFAFSRRITPELCMNLPPN